MRISQFEHNFDFTRCAILRPATVHPGHAGRLLSKVRMFGGPVDGGALLAHRDPDIPYFLLAQTKGAGDRIDHFTFSWRNRRYSVDVHSDNTALLSSTTKSGFDLRFVPIVFEIPRDITLVGDRQFEYAAARIEIDFHNHLTGRFKLRRASDWMRAAVPLLRNDRAGFDSLDFALRGLFRRHLVAEAKHIWKMVEKSDASLLAAHPWWADSKRPSTQTAAWLEQLLELAGEYFQVKTGSTRRLTLKLFGRVITAQGFLSKPRIEVATPVGVPQQDPNEVLSWVLDALDREDSPAPPCKQICQEGGAPVKIAEVSIASRDAFTAHETIEITARAQSLAA
jgi:hypothetical protein